jgi:hypothetical protein
MYVISAEGSQTTNKYSWSTHLPLFVSKSKEKALDWAKANIDKYVKDDADFMFITCIETNIIENVYELGIKPSYVSDERWKCIKS